MPWNSPMGRNDHFAPWNDPIHRNDPYRGFAANTYNTIRAWRNAVSPENVFVSVDQQSVGVLNVVEYLIEHRD